jgi:hemerythrin-like metal-binding protein
MENKVKIDWDDRYLMGIDRLDEQHMELVRMINCMYQGSTVDNEDSKNFFRQSAFRLMKYLKYHSEEEEQFMEKMKYPDLIAHMRLHADHLQEMMELIKRTEEDRFFSPAAVLRYFKESILTHIVTIDRKYATFIHVVNLQQENLTRAYQPAHPVHRVDTMNLPSEAFIG